MIEINLKNKTTLVLGGSRGIGASIVELAAEAGSHVIWTYSDAGRSGPISEQKVQSLAATGVTLSHAAVDATDASAVHNFIQETIQSSGKIDSLVYNIGFTSPVPFLDLTPDEWRRVVEINLNGAYYALREIIPHMKEKGGGAIVLIGSAAVGNGGGGRTDYVSAKAGLEGLNRAITKEFASYQIRCNLVHPSLIETDLLRQRYPDEKKRSEVAAGVPLRRLGQPEDIAYLTLFLLSDLAGYITGQSIMVDGGRTFCK